MRLGHNSHDAATQVEAGLLGLVEHAHNERVALGDIILTSYDTHFLSAEDGVEIQNRLVLCASSRCLRLLVFTSTRGWARG